MEKKVSCVWDCGKNGIIYIKKRDKMQAIQNKSAAKWTGSSWFYNVVTQEQLSFEQKNDKFKTEENAHLKK